MLEEQVRNARDVLDASPAVECNDYGEYEPRCVMGGVYIRAMEDCADEAYSSAGEAMLRAKEALAAFRLRAEAFLETVSD